MKQELKFKTNINCENCVKRVTPFIEKLEGIDSWKVDIDNPDKILTIISEGTTADQIMQAIQKTGFDIEKIN